MAKIKTIQRLIYIYPFEEREKVIFFRVLRVINVRVIFMEDHIPIGPDRSLLLEHI